MLLTKSTPIDENDNIVSLHDRMSQMGAKLLAKTLDELKIGSVLPQQQDAALTCYAPMLKKEDGLINWHQDACTIHNKVRGLSLWPGAYTFLDGMLLKIYRTRTGDGSGPPGSVLAADKGIIEVACQNGSIYIEELQLAGKKRLDSVSFLSGCRMAVGTLLTNCSNAEMVTI